MHRVKRAHQNRLRKIMTTDLTTEILKQIRDGIEELRQDFNHRLDQTNERLDQTNERLDRTICVWGG